MSTYYYKDTVLEELEELGFYNNQFLNKGLNIYTSFNSEYQKMCIRDRSWKGSAY